MNHPRTHAAATPHKPAVIMSDGSGTLTYGELEDRANRGAWLLRALGIVRGDTIAFFLPNCLEVFEVYWAGQRAGVYITPISSALTGPEAAYILENSGAKLLISTPAVPGFATLEPPLGCMVMTVEAWRAALAAQPAGPIADESPGIHMVYSSGTTGRPKGVRLPLPEGEVAASNHYVEIAQTHYGLCRDDIYLSPTPLYHTAPLVYTASVLRLGATAVVMPKFDALAALAAIEQHRITITQMVPTMFVRMLKLPEAARLAADVSSLRCVIHAAAPCPVEIKQQMLDWLGPIIHEYYGGSESNGSTVITPKEWLEKPGSVGRAGWGSIHVCDENGDELPAGTQGIVYFEGGFDFQYLGDAEKTRDSRNPQHPSWSTLGDIGYLDEDGYLFLTDRRSFVIISGGVNIYPQETENLLITHPLVADAAVIGVPHPEFGEEVRAVVQPLRPEDATEAFARDLIAFCRTHLSPIKCPRSVDFDLALPRLDNGKLYKRAIKDRYRQVP